MGNCVAGGGSLPVLCDKLLMTEGSGLYLAGPALVKAAIGQTVSHEDLGGAKMHATISGTIDYREPNEETCIERLRRLIEALPSDKPETENKFHPGSCLPSAFTPFMGSAEYDVRDQLALLLDHNVPFDEYKAEFGQSLQCGLG